MTVSKGIRSRLLVGAAFAAIVMPGAAFAQDVAPEDGLQDIVVTAERRPENQQDVPLSVATISGSTLRDFAQPDGNLGYFATRFHVYGREGEVCHHEDGGTVRRIVQGGRSTWFCPVCQR